MFTLVNLIPVGTNFGFMRFKRVALIVSALACVLSVAFYLGKGLNFGIDFRGGILLEIRTQGPADIGRLRARLNGLGLGEIQLQEFGQVSDVLIRIERQEGDTKDQLKAVEIVKGSLGGTVEYRRVEFVGPKVSKELFWDGVMAVSLAILAILVYIWFRFEWQFGCGAVVALVHDVLSTIGIFALLEFEFNLSTVAAILTIAGYSINDTVVVYDRVRENLRKFKKLPLSDLLNNSINQTLSRTLMTSLTTLLALLSLYFLGGEVIRDFSFAMIWGVIIGTYSSICLAVPVLLYLNIRRGRGGEPKGGKQAEEADSPSP